MLAMMWIESRMPDGTVLALITSVWLWLAGLDVLDRYTLVLGLFSRVVSDLHGAIFNPDCPALPRFPKMRFGRQIARLAARKESTLIYEY
tara:strand:+ start:569 stop:838 length:270 start_codon:yes stop_codon:yes gene_type:complete